MKGKDIWRIYTYTPYLTQRQNSCQWYSALARHKMRITSITMLLLHSMFSRGGSTTTEGSMCLPSCYHFRYKSNSSLYIPQNGLLWN